MTKRLDMWHPDGKAPPPPKMIPMDGSRLQLISAADIESTRYRPVPGDRWGGWYLTDVLSLILDSGPGTRWIYEVDLERVGSAIDALDWLCQVAQKTWATPEIVADLLRALECCVGPLQSLCRADRMKVARAGNAT